MLHIVVLGAGRSAGYFIDYMFQLCKSHHWKITIADQQTEHLDSLFSGYSNAHLIKVDVTNASERELLISDANWVVSMLPAFMHTIVAKDCLRLGVNMATASYESDEMREMRPEIVAKGLQFINECGLDPGIDHMSAMQIIDRLHSEGAQITSFKSYCGGLVAQECIDNPWGYKFSWNPRNVILAGQGTAKYLENGRLKFKPYSRLFREPESIRFANGTIYDGYPNRDSLSYKEIYGLNEIKTMVRGTLRHRGYCRAWNIFVQLGLTDDSYFFPITDTTTYFEFFEAFLPGTGDDLKCRLVEFIGNDYEAESIEKILWTGITEKVAIPLKGNQSPAFILQNLLERKWKLQPQDRDLVVMQHMFEYTLDGKNMQLSSSLHIEGENNVKTAMGKTVGIPLAISLKNLLLGKCTQKGLLLPVIPALYTPVLEELENDFNIRFEEVEREI
jgi:saccharopine dehydrogenase-like NADP-dependent oxidoreductase